MKPIDDKLLKNFLTLAGEKLNGKWVLLDGAVLPMMGINTRVTVDIDLAGPNDSTMADTLALFEIADSIGLPVEAINQAAAFFLHKIQNWEKSVVEIHRGSRATFFRPDVNLFVTLKVARLTETDLADCLEMLKFAETSLEQIECKNLLKTVEKSLKAAKTEKHGEKIHRLTLLKQAITKA